MWHEGARAFPKVAPVKDNLNLMPVNARCEARFEATFVLSLVISELAYSSSLIKLESSSRRRGVGREEVFYCSYYLMRKQLK